MSMIPCLRCGELGHHPILVPSPETPRTRRLCWKCAAILARRQDDPLPNPDWHPDERAVLPLAGGPSVEPVMRSWDALPCIRCRRWWPSTTISFRLREANREYCLCPPCTLDRLRVLYDWPAWDLTAPPPTTAA